MKSHELFRKLLQHCNAKQLAGEMRLSTSSIYKWAESSDEGCSGAINPLDRVEQLMKYTSSQDIAKWICARSGGFYVKNPGVSSNPETCSVTIATNKIVQEFADMLSLIAAAALDNAITEKEADKIRDCWEEMKSAAEEFVNCCEKGDFRGIHDYGRQVKKTKTQIRA